MSMRNRELLMLLNPKTSFANSSLKV